MSDISSRRRWSGRLLIGAAALALPLTGSITYAQSEAPPAPPAAPEAPVAPVAPAAPPAPTAAPAPPAPPAPPVRIVTRDGETRVIRIERHGKDGERDARKRTEKRIIIRNGHEMSAEERAEFEREMDEHRRDMAELDRDLAEMHRELALEKVEIEREVRLAVADAHRSSPKVRVHCRDGQREVAETVTTKDGETIFVCQAVAMAEARRGLAEARAEIARSHDMSKKERAKALRAIEQAERGVRAD